MSKEQPLWEQFLRQNLERELPEGGYMIGGFHEEDVRGLFGKPLYIDYLVGVMKDLIPHSSQEPHTHP